MTPPDRRPGADRPSPDLLDEAARARIRRRVLGSFEPPRPRASDRLYGAVAVLGRPAPLLVRLAAVALVVASIGATASVAAADSLPADPLYAVKLATEQARLALAASAEDRATVELSIAEHRLDEAVRLLEAGREDDALVASGAYGTEVAAAAAALATVAPSPRAAALVTQLEERLATRRAQAGAAAAKLAGDDRERPAAAVLATVSATAAPAPGSTAASRIAAAAADFSDRVAAAADDRWRIAAAPAAPAAPQRAPAVPAPARSQSAPPPPSFRAAPERPARTVDPAVAREAAERTKDAAARARIAADDARKATPAPRVSATPRPSATARASASASATPVRR